MAYLLCSFLLLVLCQLLHASDFFDGFRSGHRFQGTDRVDTDEYYSLLEVPKTASMEQIKQAYRRKALQTHPDKGGDSEVFKKINEAYETLSDPKKRDLYDRFGSQAASNAFQPPYSSNFDAFEQMFQGFGGFGNRFFSRPIVAQVEFSLEDLFKGKQFAVTIGDKNINIKMPPGMQTGQQIVVKGEITDARGVPRDLIIQINEANHARFIRRNADLLLDMKISLREALLGFSRPIEHLDGKTYWIKTKAGEITGSNDVLVLDNMGMPIPNTSQRGNLFLRIALELPKKMWLDEAELEVFESLLPVEDASNNSTSTGMKERRKGDRIITPKTHSDLSAFGSSGGTSAEKDEGDPFEFFFR